MVTKLLEATGTVAAAVLYGSTRIAVEAVRFPVPNGVIEMKIHDTTGFMAHVDQKTTVARWFLMPVRARRDEGS